MWTTKEAHVCMHLHSEYFSKNIITGPGWKSDRVTTQSTCCPCNPVEHAVSRAPTIWIACLCNHWISVHCIGWQLGTHEIIQLITVNVYSGCKKYLPAIHPFQYLLHSLWVDGTDGYHLNPMCALRGPSSSLGRSLERFDGILHMPVQSQRLTIKLLKLSLDQAQIKTQCFEQELGNKVETTVLKSQGVNRHQSTFGIARAKSIIEWVKTQNYENLTAPDVSVPTRKDFCQILFDWQTSVVAWKVHCDEIQYYKG